MRYVIIGGGPAGFSAGIQLLSAAHHSGKKIDCTIFEKSAGVEKACGGLITPKSKHLLDLLGVNLNIGKAHNEVDVHYEEVNFTYSVKSSFYVVERKELTKALYDRFCALGGTVICSRVKKYDSVEKCVFTNGKRVGYDKLIVACGNREPPSGSSAAKRECRGRNALGISTIVRDQANVKNDGKIHIWFLKRLKGYCWSFPLRDGYNNIGFAGMIDSPDDYRINKKKFEEIIGFPLISPRGATFPLGYYPDKCGIEIYTDVFVIGEAGKFFDSVSGEGIYFALYTGVLTANYISQGVTRREFAHAESKLREICRGSCFTQKFLFSNRIVLPALLHAAMYLKKLDAHLTDNLLLEYKYGYYSAYCSPLICYFHCAIPFNKQKYLNKILEESYGKEEQKENKQFFQS